MIICIGPFCIPVIWGLPFFAALFISLKKWVIGHIFGYKQEEAALAVNSSEASRVMAVHSITEWTNLLQSNSLIFVDFTASWCQPCKRVAPVFDGLSQRFSEAQFLKVDIDELEELASKFKISAMPTFVALQNGKEIKRQLGAQQAELEQFVIDIAKQQ